MSSIINFQKACSAVCRIFILTKNRKHFCWKIKVYYVKIYLLIMGKSAPMKRHRKEGKTNETQQNKQTAYFAQYAYQSYVLCINDAERFTK